MFVFRKIWCALFSCCLRFEVLPFTLHRRYLVWKIWYIPEKCMHYRLYLLKVCKLLTCCVNNIAGTFQKVSEQLFRTPEKHWMHIKCISPVDIKRKLNVQLCTGSEYSPAFLWSCKFLLQNTIGFKRKKTHTKIQVW